MEKIKNEDDGLYIILKEVEKMLSMQDKHKMYYEVICNEPIHPNVPNKDIPYKFEIPKIEPFKGNEYRKEHLRKFKYSSYFISNDNILMLWIFPMTLSR